MQNLTLHNAIPRVANFARVKVSEAGAGVREAHVLYTSLVS